MTPLLRVTDLVAEYGDTTILKGVNLSISEGEFHLIIGPNGAGKTTLLRAILAMVTPAKGQVAIRGVPVGKLSPPERAFWLGYVPQTLELSFNMDVWSFLELSRFAFDDVPSQRKSILEHSLSVTQTQHLRHHYMNELSGGEKQRVLLAAALAQKPKILILDEPGSSLDPGHRIELVRLLRELRQQQDLTILLVTHDWNEYAILDPTIIAMKDGDIAFQCQAEDLKDRLSALYDCEFHHFQKKGVWFSLPNYHDLP